MQKTWTAAIPFTDKGKAFDRVDHKFFLKISKASSFGDYFISWTKTMLPDIVSQVKVNGYLFEKISITRDLR